MFEGAIRNTFISRATYSLKRSFLCTNIWRCFVYIVAPLPNFGWVPQETALDVHHSGPTYNPTTVDCRFTNDLFSSTIQVIFQPKKTTSLAHFIERRIVGKFFIVTNCQWQEAIKTFIGKKMSSREAFSGYRDIWQALEALIRYHLSMFHGLEFN